MHWNVELYDDRKYSILEKALYGAVAIAAFALFVTVLAFTSHP